MKKAAVILVVGFVISAAVLHWHFGNRGRLTTEPEFTDLGRSASGNELISDYDPAVILRFDERYRHVGGQKFILYGVADTEQHFFVETSEDDVLKSAYWIQFEAYLPDNRYAYDYDDSPLRVSLDGFEFYADTAIVEVDLDQKRQPGTDGTLARAFLASKGYAFPGEYAYARLVYLTDESRRKELMMIFVDDLASHGVSAAELAEDGAKAPLRAQVEQAHLDKIRATLSVLPRATRQ